MAFPPAGIRALVADPSSHMAGLVTLMLHSLKVRAVDEAGDPAHLSASLARRPYGLLLIEDQLGAENDFEVIRALRRSSGHPNRLVPIVMMASGGNPDLYEAAREAGVSGFLRKPFSARDISLRLEAIRRAAGTERRSA